MTPRIRLLEIVSALSVLTIAAPAPVRSQLPVYDIQWGNSGSGNGQFSFPTAIAVDLSGNVYVGDLGNARIQKFTGTGVYLTQWEASGVYGLAVDASGHVYASDRGSHRIQKFDSNGTFLTQWGSNGSGNGEFQEPIGVAVDPAGNVYVVDSANNRVQKFTSEGVFLAKWGSLGSGNGQFQFPFGITVDVSYRVFVSEWIFNNRVQRFLSDGTFLSKWGQGGSGNGEFIGPAGMTADGAGNMYVVDNGNNRVQKFTNNGGFLGAFGSSGSGNGQFSSPNGIAIDAGGDLYVVDSSNNRIQKFSPPPPPPPSMHGLGYPKLLVHAASPVAKNPCAQGALADCRSAQTAGSLSGPSGPYYFLYLLAARNELDGVTRMACGISYQQGEPGNVSDGAGIDVFSWQKCGDVEVPDPTWPSPGGSNRIGWNPLNCQSGAVAVAGYFYMGAYSDDVFRLTETGGSMPATISDCLPSEKMLGPEDLGSAAFSSTGKTFGCNPCVVSCALAVAVSPTTWSAIKSQLWRR